MLGIRNPSIKSIAFQLLAVSVASCLFNYIADEINSTSPLNAVWMIAFPILVGIISNPTFVLRAIMAVLLLVASLVSVSLMAAVLGMGP